MSNRTTRRGGVRTATIATLLTGLAVTGAAVAPTALAAELIGATSTSAYFSTLANAQAYATNPPAGAYKQALANCQAQNSAFTSVAYGVGSVTTETNGYTGHVGWSCL